MAERSESTKQPLRVGLIGFGNIGTGVVRTLHEHAGLIAGRLPRGIELAAIADVDTQTQRNAPYDPAILSNDAQALIDSPEIDAVIELVGGTEIAKTFVEGALRAGKHVVTANKALIAKHGPELMALAEEKNVGLLYEAAVGGGIPIIRALQQGLCANQITSIAGIINGTANYILTQMEDRGIKFSRALKEAQEAGYAEADPTYDIAGYDTQHKIAILASLAFGMDIRDTDVWVEGIRAIQPMDFKYAAELGFKIKLLGIAKRENGEGPVEVRVHPTLVEEDSQLAAVRGVYNAIVVDGRPIGRTMYYGQGAGPDATSSAVVSDLMALAADCGGFNRARDAKYRIPVGEKSIRPRDELTTQYYLRFTVADVPGAMAELSRALADAGISIESMIQHKPEKHEGVEEVSITIVTHDAVEKNVRRCLRQVQKLGFNRAEPFVLRVET